MVELVRGIGQRPPEHLRIVESPGRPALQNAGPPLGLSDLQEVEVQFDARSRAIWVFTRARAEPYFTLETLAELTKVRRLVEEHLRTTERHSRAHYLVFGSKVPGIFNLGGDLAYFAEQIRSHDRDRLRAYAHSCIDAIHMNMGLGAPVVSIALVQGDALGGGFEAVLSFDVVIAERQARFGLPEILFNLFPGMGAYSVLSRRLGTAQAEKMILGGRTYSAAELHEMGLVDQVVEEGTGQVAVEDYIASHSRTHLAERAVYGIRKYVADISRAELEHIADVWVETAMQLGEEDLRRMLHLMAAQKRRRSRSYTPAL